MAQTLRLHQLAKELDVPSKVIVKKCQDEGLVEVKNHMAVISVGLAESIREWFRPGDDVTTVEVAQPVDLEKVKKPRRSKAKAAEAAASASSDDATAVAVAEAEESAPGAVTEEQPPATDESTPEEVPSGEAAPAAGQDSGALAAEPAAEVEAAVAEPPEAEDEPPAETPAEPLTPAAEVKPETPPPPAEPIRPAGPQVVPTPAELRGPRVVRIEAPDPVRAPKPRAAPGRVGELAANRDASGGTAVRPGATPGRGGKKHRPDEPDHSVRPRSPRRGTVADVVERLKEWREKDVLERKERLASATGHGLRARRSVERMRQATAPTPAGRKSEVEITTPISVKEFCSAVGVPYATVSSRLIQAAGKLVRINDMLDEEMVELLGAELGLQIRVAKAKSALEKLCQEFDERERPNARPRPPVVAMLGHVDHGKTSLLDAIRRTKVAAGEAGGITQHIGAYRVDRGDWHVTFLDTPGHEAFTAMRARGANLTDVVVLVVAADDGVMPQTVEAINHAKAAGVQIVVALNKCDLPGVDINRIYSQLSEHDLTPSEWGGTTDVIRTSALHGTGIDELLAHLSTLSELMELKADATVPARATVVEAKMREGQGSVAQVLVREGTLKTGDIFVCGGSAGRIRSLTDDKGKRIPSAEPGTPVEIGGLDDLPEAGDDLYVVGDLSEAKRVADEIREGRRLAALIETRKPATLETLLRAGSESEIPELNLILRADVQGSVDALRSKLDEFPTDKARLKVLHAGVGAITEADVQLARASSAIIIGFHIVADEPARRMADQYGVEIRLYRVIYEVLADVHKALQGLLEPVERQEQRGRAEVRQVFNVSRVGTIAGCLVVDGVIHRSHSARLVRDGRVIVERAALSSLKRFKDDAREVRAGLECGIKLEGFDDVKPGDVIEAFEILKVAAEL